MLDYLNWAVEHWFFTAMAAIFILLIVDAVLSCILKKAAIKSLTELSDSKGIENLFKEKKDENGN